MNAHTRRRGLAAVLALTLLAAISIGCNAPGYGGGAVSPTGAPASTSAGASPVHRVGY